MFADVDKRSLWPSASGGRVAPIWIGALICIPSAETACTVTPIKIIRCAAANSAASSMIGGGVGKLAHQRQRFVSRKDLADPPKIATQVTPSRLCFTHRGLESTAVMTCPGT
jgi:hypothetical protein